MSARLEFMEFRSVRLGQNTRFLRILFPVQRFSAFSSWMYSGIAVLGWSVVFYVGCRILQMLLNILYPYYIAKPVKLKEAAGGKWAGIFCGIKGHHFH